jgi:hypothetical protein
MSSYIYSVSTDFNGIVNNGKLRTNISSNVSITTICTNIITLNDIVNITFSSTLTEEELTELNSIILLHRPDHVVDYKKILYLTPSQSTTDTKTFIESLTFNLEYPNMVKDIRILSNMEIGSTNYTIQIFNDSQNVIICEKTLTNILKKDISLLPFISYPSSDDIMTLKIKINSDTGAKKIYIYYVKLFLD